MTHYGTLQNFSFNQDVDDIRGTAIYDVKGDKLGKLDDVIFDHSSGDIKYAVIDTGGFLSHKKFLIPADRIHRFERDADSFQVDLIKDHIEKKFPRFDESKLKSSQDWSDYEREYKQAWEEHPVQHRDDRLDLDVTPATVNAGMSVTGAPGANDVPIGSLGEEVTEEFTSLDEPKPHSDVRSADEAIAEKDAEGRFTPSRLAGKFPEAVQSSDKIHMTPGHTPDRAHPQARVGNESIPNRAWSDNPTASGGNRIQTGTHVQERTIDVGQNASRPQDRGADVGQWHPRMRRFEDVLRKNCVDVTASCPSCAPAKDEAA